MQHHPRSAPQYLDKKVMDDCLNRDGAARPLRYISRRRDEEP
jgi:hypothetical protein